MLGSQVSLDLEVANGWLGLLREKKPDDGIDLDNAPRWDIYWHDQQGSDRSQDIEAKTKCRSGFKGSLISMVAEMTNAVIWPTLSLSFWRVA